MQKKIQPTSSLKMCCFSFFCSWRSDSCSVYSSFSSWLAFSRTTFMLSPVLGIYPNASQIKPDTVSYWWPWNQQEKEGYECIENWLGMDWMVHFPRRLARKQEWKQGWCNYCSELINGMIPFINHKFSRAIVIDHPTNYA